MNLEKVFQYINTKLAEAKSGRRLSEADQLVLKAAWENIKYEDIAQGTEYTLNAIKGRAAPELWRLLTDVIGNGEAIKKNTFRGFMEWQLQQAESYAVNGDVKVLQTTTAHIESVDPQINSAKIDGSFPYVPSFWGREEEKQLLLNALEANRCVMLVGQVGIGKSSLVVKCVDYLQSIQSHLEYIIYRSLRYEQTFEDFAEDILHALNSSISDTEQELQKDSFKLIKLLLEALNKHHCLLILDDAETLLDMSQGELLRSYKKHSAEYKFFFDRFVREQDQSSLLVVTQEPFSDIRALEERKQLVKSVYLEGLSNKVAVKIFNEHKLQKSPGWDELIDKYRGNPLSLQMVASRIKEFFGGNVGAFLKYQTTWMCDPFQAVIHEQFAALSPLEKQIMICLAQTENPDGLSLSELLEKLDSDQEIDASTSQVLENLKVLVDRFLVERNTEDGGTPVFGLSPMIKKYVLESPIRFVREA